MNTFCVEIIAQHPSLPARVTKITTPHGDLLTPTFMPVATRAFVNPMTPEDLIQAGSQIILGGNTYHMLCAPGLDVINTNGGMHPFMNWKGPMLTDSGGFQVFSLSKNAKLCKITEEGARFKHPLTGQVIHLNSKISIETQKIIGADIIMAFDECTPESGGREKAIQAMKRTHQWLISSKEIHDRNPLSSYGLRQALFGIVQGGSFRDLREASTQFVMQLDLDGIAIGGESIGFDMIKTGEIIDWVRPLLPLKKPRYSMGVGLRPQDLIDVVSKGIDLFDCVAPTRNARHGTLYHGHAKSNGEWLKFDDAGEKDGKILIKKARFAKDTNPLLAGCECLTCKNYTRSYLHYLCKTKSPVYNHLACTHNIHVMHETCKKMRECILQANI